MRRYRHYTIEAKKKRRFRLSSTKPGSTPLLLSATILAARKLAQYDKPCPAIEAAISDAIVIAEKILRRIDEKFLTQRNA
jgi:hypothetical protein